jgi:hypothetical protein
MLDDGEIKNEDKAETAVNYTLKNSSPGLLEVFSFIFGIFVPVWVRLVLDIAEGRVLLPEFVNSKHLGIFVLPLRAAVCVSEVLSHLFTSKGILSKVSNGPMRYPKTFANRKSNWCRMHYYSKGTKLNSMIALWVTIFIAHRYVFPCSFQLNGSIAGGADVPACESGAFNFLY